MKKTTIHRIGSFCLALALSAGLAAVALQVTGNESASAVSVPAKQTMQTGVSVYQNENALVDASNAAEGYVLVKYTGGKSARIKAQITKSGSNTTYTYDVNYNGQYETFPFTEGDGTYAIRIFENVSGNQYAAIYSCEVPVSLRNEFMPFVYSNQYVNFTASSAVVAQANTLLSGVSGDINKISKIFDYVVDNFTYDYDRAATVSSGYLPNVDAVLSAKKGICFDYAAVMTAMLRSQNIPCKLVVGYAGTTYHAWINVYIEGTGWVDKVIYFDGSSWTLMDPTFVSSSKRSDAIMQYVTNTTNYTQKYAY